MRGRRMLAPIMSIKHYIQHTNVTVASGARDSFLIAAGVVAPATTLATDVIQGSVIKAVFIEVWAKGNGASDADTQFVCLFEKVPGAGGTVGASFANLATLASYDNKKNVFFVSQGVIGGVGGGQSVPILRQWFKIPKGKQRMGLGDTLNVAISTTGEAMQVCGISTYKEYR